MSLINSVAREYSTGEREKAISIDVILLCLVAASRSFFLPFFSFFSASTYATDGRVVKGKKTKTDENVCQAQKNEKERHRGKDNGVSWTFASMYVLEKTLLLLCFSRSFFLPIFIRSLLSVECSSVLGPRYFLSIPCLVSFFFFHCLVEKNDEEAIQ